MDIIQDSTKSNFKNDSIQNKSFEEEQDPIEDFKSFENIEQEMNTTELFDALLINIPTNNSVVVEKSSSIQN